MFDRSRQQNLSSYFGEQGVIKEEEEDEHKSQGETLQDSSSFTRPKLDPVQEGTLRDTFHCPISSSAKTDVKDYIDAK